MIRRDSPRPGKVVDPIGSTFSLKTAIVFKDHLV
uniref:Uncharacterized protein n=1 Tax=Globisporangium ultimum (strain ATCC 200006 / CBS 805.95 / DAOM BR144) TaxID=431595 RepID=K3WKX3_GLOUD